MEHRLKAETATKYLASLYPVTIICGARKVALRIRGRINSRSGKPAHYPGSCMPLIQVTCKPGKRHKDLIADEFRKTFWLGPDLAEKIDRLELVRLKEAAVSGKVITNYGAFISFDDLSNIKMSALDGGMRLIDENDTPYIRNVADFNKEVGITSSDITAMFEDEIPIPGLAIRKVHIPDD